MVFCKLSMHGNLGQATIRDTWSLLVNKRALSLSFSFSFVSHPACSFFSRLLFLSSSFSINWEKVVCRIVGLRETERKKLPNDVRKILIIICKDCFSFYYFFLRFLNNSGSNGSSIRRHLRSMTQHYDSLRLYGNVLSKIRCKIR